jgi:hypothetical protein
MSTYIKRLTEKHAKAISFIMNLDDDSSPIALIAKAAEEMANEMPKTFHDEIWGRAGEVIGENVFNGEKDENSGYTIAACVVLLCEHELIEESTDNLNIAKYEQNENCDWDWIASNMMPYLPDDAEFHFVLKLEHMTPETSLDTYMIVKCDSREQGEEALIHCAQAFVNGSYDVANEWFVTDETKVRPIEAKEVTKEFADNSVSIFSFAYRDSLAAIKADKEEVQAYFDNQ